MAIQGTYSARPDLQASPEALRAAFRGVYARPAAALAAGTAPPTADEQANALADALVAWLRVARLVVDVYPIGDPASPAGDLALQTATAPGSPTAAPAARMELLGSLLIGEG